MESSILVLGFRLTLRVLQALVSGVSAAAILSKENDWPSEQFWLDHPGYFQAAIAGFILGAVLVPLVEGFAEYVRQRAPAAQLAVMELLLVAFYNVMKATGLRWDELGLHAFVVRRPLRRLFRAEQKRVGTVRFGPVPPPSRIRWTRGKGLIGRCWAERTDQGADLVADFGPYANATRAEWESLPEDSRYGLSFDEYTRTKDSYGAIVATPLLTDKGRYRGCVAVDAPGTAYDKLWEDPAPRGILHASAQAMMLALEGVS